MNGLQEMDGSYVKNSVALLYSSDNEYGFKLQHQAEGMYYLEQLKSLHDGFTTIGVGVDIIDESADLSAYEIVLAPTMLITHEETEKALHEFAAQGGTVLLTNRSGVKDVWNKCIMEPLPSIYKDLIGAQVQEYDVPGERKGKLDIVDDTLRREYIQCLQCNFEQEQDLPEAEINILYQQWCDILKTDSAEILASYGDCYYAGQPAITRNHFGKGRAYYIGTVCNRSLYIALAKCMAKEKGISYYDNLPLGVEITYRRKEETVWRFIFNNTGKTQEIRIDDVQYLLNPFEMKMERLTQ